MTKAVTPDMWMHNGWSISFDAKPIPCRDFDWTASSPDYDCDCDQDGFFVCGGASVNAATYKDLLVEIDCAIADMDDTRRDDRMVAEWEAGA